MSSYKKHELVSAIENHFRRMGRRMTNLTKSTNDRLLDIIKKYNINLDEEVNAIRQEKIRKQEKEKLEQEHREKMWELREKMIKRTIDILTKKNKMKEWREEVFERKYIKRKIFTNEELEKNKIEKELRNKKREQRFQLLQSTARTFERIDEDTININGINITECFMNPLYTSQEEYDEEYYREKKIRREDENEMSDYQFILHNRTYIIQLKKKEKLN